ncbi:MBL fold metallo-hydrolase [Papillibacter cinnamivorans]|uniref:Glyoxylase, beta-lactamase superfamily II n=1 Tax=Papillibacter cinnamivorans DSM 12816 TaxID=1122930 RepID=A0A1W2B7M5_9FIRM|nr:MBL fold metallo-hydrolase [Papillibacter cinnamivorans]SMC68929.1 Glyoxylase, beta-lactamase superfamily II [Papillibacter cinnamivorans DSM 12816]
MKQGAFEITEVKPGVWCIAEPDVCSYLVEGTERALLIDTGYSGEDIRSAAESLTFLPITVIITHGHVDHIAGCAQFPEVLCHSADFWLLRINEKITSPLPRPFLLKSVWDGDIIDLGGRTLEVLYLPGHTPGNIALLDRENRILFGGDTVQEGPIWLFEKNASLEAFLDSLRRLSARAGDFDTVLASHHTKVLSPEILVDLIELSEQILDGKAQWEAADVWGRPCRTYRLRGVSIYHF